MNMFLRNRLAFKKQYILKIYDDQKSPSAVLGQAAHKALEMYYGGLDSTSSIEVGLKFIEELSDAEINYGKTGSREKLLKEYNQAISFYLEEAQEYKIRDVEKKLTHFIEIDGEKMPIAAKSITDLVIENDEGGIDIIDYKFSKFFTTDYEDNPVFILQAMFNYHTIKQECGIAPTRMIFNECKISKNKNGEPQVQPWIIEFEKQKDYFVFFKKIYKDCTTEILKPDIQYLPNFSDIFDGKNSFEVYRSDLIDVAPPIPVQHKTEKKEFVEKKNYIESALDKEENKDFTDEERIRVKLQEFGLMVEMKDTFYGLGVIQYTLKPSRGVRMSGFEKHTKDLALALKAKTIRIEAPIMGTDLVGIEVPKQKRGFASYPKDIELEQGKLKFPVGVNVYGQSIVKDLAEMPHLLIAGATGTGKSVMISSIIKSLVDVNDSDILGFIMIDPKRVELSRYNDLPHLESPVIFDNLKAKVALHWLVREMENRYSELEKSKYRHIDEYNENNRDKMRKLVLLIDEFADLILQSEDKEAETAIILLAQKARAVGIHLILATQRPSVNVITGLIKANMPTRIAFRTTSKVDSQIILDQNGAEELLGKGDLLLLDPHERGLLRLQGYYIE
tara:strand:- start:4327 stop:6180 length:1854 start_codon:yes stop_codon:yes gene_type:complete